MAGFSNYLSAKLLNLVWGKVSYDPPDNLYLALFTVTPTDSTPGTEATGGGYARVAIENSLASFPEVLPGGEKTNALSVTFPTLTAGIGNIVGFGYFDAPTGGNLLAAENVDTPRIYNTSDTPKFLNGDLTVGLT